MTYQNLTSKWVVSSCIHLLSHSFVLRGGENHLTLLVSSFTLQPDTVPQPVPCPVAEMQTLRSRRRDVLARSPMTRVQETVSVHKRDSSGVWSVAIYGPPPLSFHFGGRTFQSPLFFIELSCKCLAPLQKNVPWACVFRCILFFNDNAHVFLFAHWVYLVHQTSGTRWLAVRLGWRPSSGPWGIRLLSTSTGTHSFCVKS